MHVCMHDRHLELDDVGVPQDAVVEQLELDVLVLLLAPRQEFYRHDLARFRLHVAILVHEPERPLAEGPGQGVLMVALKGIERGACGHCPDGDAAQRS